MRLGDLDALKAKLQKQHDFFIDAWKENGVDYNGMPIPDKSRVDEITNCIAMVQNAPTFEITEQQAIDKLHETGWLIKHDKEMTEKPQGKWIKQEWGYVCSLCGESNDYAYDNNIHKFVDNYCPHCGADMRGSDHEQK